MSKHMFIHEDLAQALPFGVFDDDEVPNLICRFSHEEDAEAYIAACNSHDALVGVVQTQEAVITKLLAVMSEAGIQLRPWADDNKPIRKADALAVMKLYDEAFAVAFARHDQVKAALAAAGVKP